MFFVKSIVERLYTQKLHLVFFRFIYISSFFSSTHSLIHTRTQRGWVIQKFRFMCLAIKEKNFASKTSLSSFTRNCLLKQRLLLLTNYWFFSSFCSLTKLSFIRRMGKFKFDYCAKYYKLWHWHNPHMWYLTFKTDQLSTFLITFTFLSFMQLETFQFN